MSPNGNKTIDERRQALQREIEKFEAWAAECGFYAAITEPAALTEFYKGHCLDQLNELVTKGALSS